MRFVLVLLAVLGVAGPASGGYVNFEVSQVHPIGRSPSGNRLLAVNTPDVGEAVEELVCTYDADNMEIGYNARYLLDILKTMDSDDVHFKLDRNDNAGVLIPANAEGDLTHTCLLMPLRLSD